MSNKSLVTRLVEQGLRGGNKRVIEELIPEDYIQHNPTVPTGREPLMQFPAIEVTSYRILADRDFVATHSCYQWGGQPTAAFDVFRINDGQLVEHWDVMQAVPTSSANGHTMFDGSSEITDLADTERNRTIVKEFVETVLLGGQFDRTAEFINATNYVQHNPQVGDGLAAFFAFAGNLQAKGISFRYLKLHHLIAEGNFVLTGSEGEFGGNPTAFYDLFRLENGLIVEHWDVIQIIPTSMPHTNGMF
jgi:predicted SnoaL-like aldol condensation-catalyzing enzyme